MISSKIELIGQMLELKKDSGEISSYYIKDCEGIIDLYKRKNEQGVFYWSDMYINIFDSLLNNEISIILSKTFPTDLSAINEHISREVRELKLNKIIDEN